LPITRCILAPTVSYKARNTVHQNYISLSFGVNVIELQSVSVINSSIYCYKRSSV